MAKGTIFINSKTGEEKFFLFSEDIPPGFLPKEDLVVEGEFGPQTISKENFAARRTQAPINASSGQEILPQTADFSDVNALINQQELEEQFSGPLGQTRAFFTGLGSGASFGLLDPAISTAIGKDEFNAARSTTGGFVGELTGTIAPALVTGGGSLASLARLTPAGLVGRAGLNIQRGLAGLKGVAAAGAFEGAAYGVGQGISNLALTNKPLTAESLVSEIGLNALYGAGFGAAGGFAGELLSLGGQKLANFGKHFDGDANVVLTESVESIGNLVHNQARQLRQIGDNLIDNIDAAKRGIDINNVQRVIAQADEYLENIVKSERAGTNPGIPSAKIKKLQELQVELKAASNNIPKSVDVVNKLKQELSDVPSAPILDIAQQRIGVRGPVKDSRIGVRDIDVEGPSPLDIVPSKANDVLRKTQPEIFAPGARTPPDFDAIAKRRLLQEVDAPIIADAFGKTAVIGKKEVSASLPRMVPDDSVSQVSKVSEVFDPAGKISQMELSPVGRVFAKPEDELNMLIGRVELSGKQLEELFNSPQAFKEFLDKDLDEAFSFLKKLDDQQQAIKQLAKHANDPGIEKVIDRFNVQLNEAIESITGTVGKEFDPQLMLMLVGAGEIALPDFDGPLDNVVKFLLAYKLASRQGVIANPILAQAAKRSGFQNAVKQAAGVAGRQAGFEAARGANPLVRGGLVVAGQKVFGKVADIAIDGTSKMAHATGKNISRVTKALGKTISTSGKAVRKISPFIAPQVLRDFNPTDEETKKESPEESVKRIANQLDQMVTNPGTVIHDALAPVRAINLEVGDHLAGQAARTAAFLQSKVPRDPGFLQNFGQSFWRPREEDVQKFARYIRATKDPAGIIERFTNQEATREDWEVLETLYPEHKQLLDNWMAENLQEIQTKWSYSYRVHISRLTQNPIEPTTRFNWQTTYQESANQPIQQEQPSENNQPTQAQSLAAGARE